MSDNNPRWSFNIVFPTVTAFLGLLSFTAMLMIMQYKAELQFSKDLIVGTAIISFLFIIATLGGSTDQRNSPTLNEKFKNLVKYCFGIAVIGLIATIPVLVYSFSKIGTLLLICIEVLIIPIFVKYSPYEFVPKKS